jgi:(2Fe-2S) ferredoxin
MGYYQKHVFFCENTREDDSTKLSCGKQIEVKALREYARKKLKNAGVSSIRTSLSGCLGRCNEGPVLVIYPDGIWYKYSSQQDIDDIIEASVLNTNVVDKLILI